MEELKKYFAIVANLRAGRQVQKGDLEFFLSYSPQIDEAKMKKLVDGGEFASFEDAQAAILEAGRALQSSPEYKQQLVEFIQATDADRTTSKIAQAANLILGGADILTSMNQIRQADKAARESKRPSRPVVPQRDLMLQQALRQSQENTFDSERAIAPVRAEIQDQYLNDIQGAKTASTGQAGAYGAYRQLAANRRNRAAMELAPIQDSIKAREQQRTDNLLGMRANETQQMFQNQASLYPYDLQQYNWDQRAAASLGATGRANLRDSLYNMAGQAAGFIGQNAAQRKYDKLRNQALAAGIDPNSVIKAEQNLRGYLSPETNESAYYEQLYGGN